MGTVSAIIPRQRLWQPDPWHTKKNLTYPPTPPFKPPNEKKKHQVDVPCTPQALVAAGAYLGRMDHALDGFDHPGAHREHLWDIQVGLKICIGVFDRTFVRPRQIIHASTCTTSTRHPPKKHTNE